MRVRTSDIAKELSLDYECFCSDASEPKLTNVLFKDVLPRPVKDVERFSRLGECRLFQHQLDCLNALASGRNTILVSGTGSGKTEAWVAYALRNNAKAIAIYPTLALSADQVSRLNQYYTAVYGSGDSVVIADASTASKVGTDALKRKVLSARLVVTNPAYLMVDLKRAAHSPAKSVLAGFLQFVDLIVADELDFYGSHGASLLMTLIEIICKFISSRAPQVAVLTATLGNPDDLAQFLTSVTGRETVVIKGKPLKLRNCTYLILGKDLERLRNQLMRELRETHLAGELFKWLSNPELFRRNVDAIVAEARRHGVKVGSPYFDPSELISKYVNDDVVTLVFTPSIRTAEKLAARVKSHLPQKLRCLVATHHHLVRRDVRREVEAKAAARPPQVKVIITVRTLLQGIDLPTVGRVVHYGLPYEVREYMQREGRKGRRSWIGETESVIIPVSRWDRELASMGRDGLREFESIPLEKVYVITRNKYSLLFKSLYKLLSNSPLTDEELKLLNDLGLVTLDGGHVSPNDKAFDVWRNLNFYEYGPPYGIKRVLRKGGKEVLLEEVSRRDLVEKYQSGALDHSEEAVVVKAGYSGVEEVKIADVIEEVEEIPDWLKQAISSYESIKLRWGEKPNILLDMALGKLSASVEVGIYIPHNGFGRLTEKPLGVVWSVESRNRFKLVAFRNSLIRLYDREAILLGGPTEGVYRDMTYGLIRVLDPATELEDLRVASAALMLILRLARKYLISFRELRVATYRHSGGRLAVAAVWEPEASGLLEVLDWSEVSRIASEFSEPKLWLQLLTLIDDEARDRVLQAGLRWEDVRSMAAELAMWIGGCSIIELLGRKVVVPKPSRELGIHVIEVTVGDKGTFKLGYFDGEAFDIREVSEAGLPKHVQSWIRDKLAKILDEGGVLVTATDLREYLFSRSATLMLDTLISEGRLVNPFKELKKVLGAKFIPVDDSVFRKAVGGRLLKSVLRGPLKGGEGGREEMMVTLLTEYGAYLVVKELSGGKGA